MTENIIKILLIWVVLITSVNAKQNYLDVCLKQIKIRKSNEYRVTVRNNTVKNLSSQFFGFNINWFGFQDSYWDDQEKKIIDNITKPLKNDFNGAIYRYPGGSVANLFDWEESIGHVESRQKQKPVYWYKPVVSKFGYQEFIDFVNSVDGKPWIVNNLHGDYEKEEQIELLADKAEKWVIYSLLHKHNIERWELGNELDRGKYLWPANKYSRRAQKVGEAIKNIDPNAKLVSMLRDYNVEGHGSGNKYNQQLATKVLTLGNEFALHQYYDGPTGGPSIPNRLTHICSSIAEIKKETEEDISIWITEHARWPHAKKPINWKIEKQQTYNLQSAISVADYIIAVSLLPEVKGAFYHALSGANGPWTLFHDVDNSIRHSIVYRSLQILRENMLSVVLDIDIQSKNKSNYFGGYDFRASVQTNLEQTKYNIWMVNRSINEENIVFKIPQLASQKKNAVMLSIFDSNLNRNNMNTNGELLPVRNNLYLVFNQSGEVKIKTPGQSVSTILIQ